MIVYDCKMEDSIGLQILARLTQMAEDIHCLLCATALLQGKSFVEVGTVAFLGIEALHVSFVEPLQRTFKIVREIIGLSYQC